MQPRVDCQSTEISSFDLSMFQAQYARVAYSEAQREPSNPQRLSITGMKQLVQCTDESTGFSEEAKIQRCDSTVLRTLAR